MSIYNKYTTDAHISVELIGRNDRSDASTWKVTLKEDINELGRTDGKVLRAGTTFRYEDEYDANGAGVVDYIRSRGLLDACNISDADFERKYLSGSDEMVLVSASELAELRKKAAKYDKLMEGYRRGAKQLNDVSMEERSARAKKAVEARIAKYGQARRK